MRVAFSSMVWNTGFKSPGDELITRSTSDVAVCSPRACANSRVRALTCSCRSATVELACRAAVGALFGLGFFGLLCCVVAGLRLIAQRRLTEPSHWADHHTLAMRPVVHHSKIH